MDAQGDWLKPGCVVIDVGVNSKPSATDKRGYILVGDVDFEAACQVDCSRTHLLKVDA